MIRFRSVKGQHNMSLSDEHDASIDKSPSRRSLLRLVDRTIDTQLLLLISYIPT